MDGFENRWIPEHTLHNMIYYLFETEGGLFKVAHFEIYFCVHCSKCYYYGKIGDLRKG